jgi:hypothetical protein
MFYISKLFHHTLLWGIFHFFCLSVYLELEVIILPFNVRGSKDFTIFSSMSSFFARDPLHRAGRPALLQAHQYGPFKVKSKLI